MAGRALYGGVDKVSMILSENRGPLPDHARLGTFGVNLIRESGRRGSGKLALIAAALLALSLGGCGRKSGLDAPPQASVQPGPGDPAQAQSQPRGPLGLFDAVEEDRPVAAQGKKRRIILDPILD